MAKVIYAFSGDPITFGHIDIINRATKVFEHVIVAIGSNPDKKYTFTLEERKLMAEKSLAKYSNVSVTAFDGLLVDFAYENSISLIIKGVRNSKDFDYELDLHQVGESQKHGIDTFFIPASQEKTHISSSTVKAIQLEQGLVHDYVPLYVKEKLEEKISNQFIVGVTGEIGSGKTHVSKKFSEVSNRRGIESHVIELDKIGHAILNELKEPLYSKVRESIANEFGKEVLMEDGFIDRGILGKIVFEDNTKLEKLNLLMRDSLLMRLKKELYGKKGLIFVDAALLAEFNILHLVNNNLVLVTVDKNVQTERLEKRGLSSEQIERRISSQYNTELKRKNILEQIEKDNQGNLWEFDNSNPVENQFEDTISSIFNYFRLIK